MNNKPNKIRRLRKGRCTAILVLIIMAVILLSGSWGKTAGADGEQDFHSITVSQGDSLWSLVQEHYDYKGDIRKAIYEVRQLNGLTDTYLQPGQILQIPR